MPKEFTATPMVPSLHGTPLKLPFFRVFSAGPPPSAMRILLLEKTASVAESPGSKLRVVIYLPQKKPALLILSRILPLRVNFRLKLAPANQFLQVTNDRPPRDSKLAGERRDIGALFGFSDKFANPVLPA